MIDTSKESKKSYSIENERFDSSVQRSDEEQLEVYHTDGTPAGYGVSRNEAHVKGILHGASHIYICKRERGQLYFLLQRRSENKDSYPGCLDISSAGHVELGSDFIKTAIKELYEELGICATADDFIELFIQSIDVRNTFRGKPFIDREINKVYLYKKIPEDKEISIQKEELSETVWSTAEEILSALDRCDPEFCMNPEEFRKVMEILDAGEHCT